MQMRALGIMGAWEFTPRQHADDRGVFLEAYTAAALREVAGHDLTLAQLNVSVSATGTVRGVHFADVPPGQAKYVQCASGAVLDVIVDIRVGSPTFGSWDAVLLDDVDRRAVYISEGLGHAFCALRGPATVMYACSTPFNPTAEHGITPLDPDLDLPWPTDIELLLSPKDRAAPTLPAAREAGLLPTYGACLAHTRDLQSAPPR